jgi:hypothetical protein
MLPAMPRIFVLLGLAVFAGAACNPGGEASSSDTGDDSGDAGDTSAVTESPGAPTLFGEPVSSYVEDVDGTPTLVGVIIPIAAFENAPDDGPFQDDLILDMPALARDKTMLSQLRVNWLAHGHGPAPYSGAHFDLHFYRGTSAEIDAIDCQDHSEFPPEVLTADHQTPGTCVSRMGYHAWPSADALPGAVFTASLILGYYAKKMVFIEPMIARTTLLAREDFELAISTPMATGGPPTLYPTRMRARYVAAESAYHFEFDTFVALD